MNTKISQELSNKIANMGIICAILVVFIHLPRLFGGFGEQVLAGCFSRGIAKIAVPFFFLASGYFLAGHLDEDGWYGREVLPSCFFDEVEYLDFEFMKIPVIKNYREVLKINYGNWEKHIIGAAAHGGMFIDVERPYTEYLTK